MKDDEFREDLLLDGLWRLGISYEPHQIERLWVFLREITLWNRRINLVKAKGDELIVRHVLDSLSGLNPANDLNPKSVLDVGSGGGFPGVPLSIFMPRAKFTLLDRSAKRTSFLQNVKALCPLENCEVVHRGVENHRAIYDLICCRAFMSADDVLKNASHLLHENGALMLFKGREASVRREISQLPPGWKYELTQVQVPYLNEERHLLFLRQTNR